MSQNNSIHYKSYPYQLRQLILSRLVSSSQLYSMYSILSILLTFGKMHRSLAMILLGSLLTLILMLKLGVWPTIITLKVGVLIAGSLQIPLFHFYLLLLIYLHRNKFDHAFLVLIKAGVREGVWSSFWTSGMGNYPC